ncbi:MAG: MC/SLC25 family protein [Gammaproteobacteria bacterium]|nr:MC/SLC25 family protein [Gammaproteobacteria bacterium]
MSNSTKQTPTSLSTSANIISLITAATVSGIPADIASFPFCRVKTVMMTQVGENAQFSSTYQTASNIYKMQGLPGFYRGFSPFLASSIPGSALFFFGVDATQSFLGDSAYSVAAAGFVGQATGSLAWIPGEILKELRQMTTAGQAFQNKSVTELTTHIYKQEGIRGFYRGFLPQLLSFGPFNSIGLSMSAALHKKLLQEEPTTAQSMAINGVSFGFGAGITTPIDVIKTRIQVASANPTKFPDRSILGCAENIIKNEGVGTFFSGATSRVGWLGIRQALAVTMFGKVNTACRDYLLEDEVTPKGP